MGRRAAPDPRVERREVATGAQVAASARARRRRELRAAAAAVALVAATLPPATARAQACCAGGAAVTPARLAMHEDFLVGIEARAASIYGSYDAGGRYVAAQGGANEVDLEQDVLLAARVLRDGQISLQVPFVQTFRAVPGQSALGGGLGDVNLGARWDFTVAGQSRRFPGVGLLAGVTLPTGLAPEAATHPLAVDATGIGAFQATCGLAVEQTFGPVFLGVNALLSARSTRHVNGIDETLGPQATAVVAGAYTFKNDGALGASLAYAVEGEPVIDGVRVAGGGHRLTTVGVLGLLPVADDYRLQGSAFVNPPWGALGANQPASFGFSLVFLRSWS